MNHFFHSLIQKLTRTLFSFHKNILLLRKNELVVKIADFGFARELFDEDMAATFCGSPLYMVRAAKDMDVFLKSVFCVCVCVCVFFLGMKG